MKIFRIFKIMSAILVFIYIVSACAAGANEQGKGNSSAMVSVEDATPAVQENLLSDVEAEPIIAPSTTNTEALTTTTTKAPATTEAPMTTNTTTTMEAPATTEASVTTNTTTTMEAPATTETPITTNTTTTASAADTASVTSKIKNMEKETIDIINRERTKAGLPPLIAEESYYPYVQLRANECNEVFSHTRPNGKSFVTVYTENDVRFSKVGENIGARFKEPTQIMSALMDSPGHRNNIMNTAYTHVCVAIVPMTTAEGTASEEFYVLVQHFHNKGVWQ